MFILRRLMWLLTIFLIGCTEQPEKPPLRISLDVWPGYAYVLIAQEKNLFEKYGVKAELVLKPTPIEAQKLFETKAVDGRLSVFSDIVLASEMGIPTRAVYMADYSDTGDVIIGLAEFDNLSDLKGKTIAFDGVETFSHMFVVGALAKAGIQLGEYKAENLAVQAVSKALEAGTIDAGHTWEPTTSEALAKGYKILAKAGDIPGVITDVLAFHTQAIEERPGDIQNVVRALVEARNFLETNEAEAIQIMAQAMGMSEPAMREGVAGVHNPNLEENIAAMQPGGALFQSAEIAINFYTGRGKLFREQDIATFIDNRFVSALH